MNGSEQPARRNDASLAALTATPGQSSTARTMGDPMNLTNFIESDLQGLVEDWAKHALAISQALTYPKASCLIRSPDPERYRGGHAQQAKCGVAGSRVACDCRRLAIQVQPGG